MIELAGVGVSYGDKAVLRDVTYRFEPGTVTAVVGRNGSGKSTLLRAMVGLVPHVGSILIDGREVSEMGHRERARRVAYLPQQSVPARMDVLTLVSHGRYARLGPSQALGETDREAIRHAMELTDTWDLRDRLVPSLSGGERQRAYLAMAVAQGAPTLLLDEPTASLDIAHRLEVGRLLQGLAKEGIAVVATSHDLVASFTVSSRIVVVAHATIAAVGTPDELVGEPGVLREAMGASVVRQQGEGLLYPYSLAR
ncbi:MAG: ABC transporter ATP-binding protein [Olegusella sp.]|nr:ABC transporter ATP-binding protein [Olegusella sp.]